MHNICSLDELCYEELSICKASDSKYKVLYGGKQLYFTTSCWSCPYGLDDRNMIFTLIGQKQYEKITALDRLGCELKEKYSIDKYKSIVTDTEGIEGLMLFILPSCRMYDKDAVLLEETEAKHRLSGQCSLRFIVEPSLEIWNEMLLWRLKVHQLKIDQYYILPQGCQIFENEGELQEVLSKKKIVIKKRNELEDPARDFDQAVNELLD